MKNKVFIAIVAVLVVVATVVAFVFFSRKNDNAIVATSAFGNVTNKELEEQLKDYGGNRELKNLTTEEKEILVKQIINQRKLLKDAEASGIASQDVFKAKARKQYNDLLKEEYLQQMVDARVSAEAVKNEYESMKKEMDGQMEYKVKHILVKTKTEIDKVVAELKTAKFEDLAKKYSIDGTKENGGDLGYIMIGQTVPEFEAVMKEQALNKVSAPFETKFGWHILLKTEEKTFKMPSFDDSKENIKNALIGRVINEYTEKNLTEANIQFNK